MHFLGYFVPLVACRKAMARDALQKNNNFVLNFPGERRWPKNCFDAIFLYFKHLVPIIIPNFPWSHLFVYKWVSCSWWLQHVQPDLRMKNVSRNNTAMGLDGSYSLKKEKCNNNFWLKVMLAQDSEKQMKSMENCSRLFIVLAVLVCPFSAPTNVAPICLSTLNFLNWQKI